MRSEHRFDDLAKAAAGGLTRRGTMKLLGGLAALALGRRVVEAAPARVPVVAGVAAQKDTYYMFIQEAASGTFLPNSAAPGLYTLTLSGVDGETIYFSDRPVRDAGRVAMQPFLNGFPFSPDNPPNAALVVAASDGSEDTLVIEIFNPRYDSAARTLTYDARILPNYIGTGLAVFAGRAGDPGLAQSFSDASMFIDDCPNSAIGCYNPQGDAVCFNDYKVGCCYSWSSANCEICQNEIEAAGAYCAGKGAGWTLDSSDTCSVWETCGGSAGVSRPAPRVTPTPMARPSQTPPPSPRPSAEPER